MEFTEVPIPTGTKRGRPALPNPFEGQFPTKTAIKTELAFAENSTEVKRLVRQARQAARDLNLRAFVKVDALDAENTRVTVWTKPKPSEDAESVAFN